MTAPILMSEKTARAYLDGADPALLAPPLRLGRRLFWARAALDRAVAGAAGLAAPETRTPDEAYDAWKTNSAA